MRLLDEIALDRRVRNDAAFDKELAAPGAAGLEPLFVQPQQIAVRRAGRPLADFGQDIHETYELLGELSENRRKPVAVVTAQRVVRASTDGDVIVDVHELSPKRIGEEPGD